jgi:hypothetical protein
MNPDRFRVEWISAAEGDKYSRVINEMQAALDNIPRENCWKKLKRCAPPWRNARAVCAKFPKWNLP